jgi:large subunit ribosomal protein L13
MKRQDTYYAKPKDIDRKWYIIDAKNQILGRIASKVASILRGKEKASFTPSVDVGDFVVVINAKDIKVTGNKDTDKQYHSHSGYPGGLKTISYKDLMQKDATKVLHNAIKGMLPKNRIGRAMIKKVKIYAQSEHPHAAQKCVELKLTTRQGGEV